MLTQEWDSLTLSCRCSREPLDCFARFVRILAGEALPVTFNLCGSQGAFQSEDAEAPLVPVVENPTQELGITATWISVGADPVPPEGLPDGDHITLAGLGGGHE